MDEIQLFVESNEALFREAPLELAIETNSEKIALLYDDEDGWCVDIYEWNSKFEGYAYQRGDALGEDLDKALKAFEYYVGDFSAKAEDT